METLNAFLATQMWKAAETYSVQHPPKPVTAAPEQRRSTNVH